MSQPAPNKPTAAQTRDISIRSNQLERRQLAVRLLFGVERHQGLQELLNLTESVEGVAAAMLLGHKLVSRSTPAELEQSAQRTRQHLHALQDEIGGHNELEFISIETPRGALCYIELEGLCLCVQLDGAQLPTGSRERLYLLAEACQKEIQGR